MSEPLGVCHVAPYVGAWIETLPWYYYGLLLMSHPMWVRGLKHILFIVQQIIRVAPYVGAWIETRYNRAVRPTPSVAPYVGAWIETCYVV